MNGKRALSTLDFEIRSVWKEPVDLKLEVTSDGGSKGDVARALPAIQVPGAGVTAHKIAVAELPAQRSDGTVGTLVSATYTASDGVRRSITLPAIWAQHEPGFGSAFVRGEAEEAAANAERGLSALVQAADTANGRVFNAENASFEAASEGGWSRLVGHLPELPDPLEIHNSFSDGARTEKSGSFNICITRPYGYVDASQGEDFLNISPFFITPAAHMIAILGDSNGNGVWLGILNASGCTGPVFHADGTYTAFLAPHLRRAVAGGDVVINIFPNNTQQTVWAAKQYTISGSGGTVNVTMSASTLTPTGNAAAALSMMLVRQSAAIKPSTSTVLTDQNCPGIQGSACQQGSTLFLGSSLTGSPYTSWKYVMLHEFGHRVQDLAFGLQNHPYLTDAVNPLCTCDHVSSSNQAHCLQSREDIESAQVEGFAHLFASDVFNNGTQDNCTFVYYKEFRNEAGTILSPPVARSCLNAVRWMETFCDAPDQGTELDWMGFYWRLRNKTTQAYSHASIEAVYETACGGSCAGSTNTGWTPLTNAVTTIFGATTPKTLHWVMTGDSHGVDK